MRPGVRTLSKRPPHRLAQPSWTRADLEERSAVLPPLSGAPPPSSASATPLSRHRPSSMAVGRRALERPHRPASLPKRLRSAPPPAIPPMRLRPQPPAFYPVSRAPQPFFPWLESHLRCLDRV